MKIQYIQKPFSPYTITVESLEDHQFLVAMGFDAIQHHENLRRNRFAPSMWSGPHEKYSNFIKNLGNIT